MQGFLQILRLAFLHRSTAVLVIVSNLLFIIFNLLSLILFVPFLKLIFSDQTIEELSSVSKPIWASKEGVFDFFSQYYDYLMADFVVSNGGGKIGALGFICVTVLIAFFFNVVPDLSYVKIYLSIFGAKDNKAVFALEMIFREPVSIALHLIILFSWSVELTLFALILLPISAFAISRIGKSLKRTSAKGQKQMGILLSIIEESLGGVRIIKAFTAEKLAMKRFNKENNHHQNIITRSFRKH